MILSIFLKHKKHILIGVGLLVLVIVTWYLLSKDKPVQANVPNDNPNGLPSEAEIAKANQIARALFTTMDGFEVNPWGKDMTAYQDLIKSSDKVFVLVYNQFNKLYSIAGKGTLRQWMKDEGYIIEDENLVYKVIFPRMDRLNLE